MNICCSGVTAIQSSVHLVFVIYDAAMQRCHHKAYSSQIIFFFFFGSSSRDVSNAPAAESVINARMDGCAILPQLRASSVQVAIMMLVFVELISDDTGRQCKTEAECFYDVESYHSYFRIYFKPRI